MTMRSTAQLAALPFLGAAACLCLALAMPAAGAAQGPPAAVSVPGTPPAAEPSAPGVRAPAAAMSPSARVPGMPLPEATRPQDPADSLYRAARSQINSQRWADAARTLQLLRERHPRSTYVGDSHYFEALVRSRLEGPRELRQAVELLRRQQERYPDAGTAADGRELLVRLEARLAERGDARAAQSVVSAARSAARCDGEEGVRATALSALLNMNPERARPLLMEVLRDRDECTRELRERAVFILAQNPDDETVGLLVELARTDPDPEIRERAVFWLSQTGKEEAVDALLEILESGQASPEVQEKAIFALGQHPSERAAQAMRRYASAPGGDPEVRANAIFWLGQRGGVEASSYLRDLYTELSDPELKERVLFSVAQGPNNAENLRWLTARALDENEAFEVRKQALFWAGQGGMQANELLRVYRTARDPELREQAIFVLTQSSDSTAVEALMEIARTEENLELRERAIFWLGQSDDPRAVELLIELVRRGGGRGVR